MGTKWTKDYQTPGRTTCYSTVVMYSPYEMGVSACKPFYLCPSSLRPWRGAYPQPPDHETAYRFREGFYKFVGVPLPGQPARRILFWMRNPNAGRSFTNLDELLAIADAYKVPYT